MRKVISVLVFLSLAPVPAHAKSHWSDCLKTPTYRCLIDLAAAEAGHVPDRIPRAYATALLAGAQAVGGLADEARANAEEARVLGGIIFDDADYGLLVSQIVWAKAWAGDLDAASDMLGWTTDPYALALGYAALAEAQAHHGYPENAQRSMQWAMEELDSVRGNRGVLLPYMAISNGYIGSAEGVHRLIAESRKVTDAVDIAYVRTLAAAAGAVAEAMVGHAKESDALLAEAEGRLADIEDPTDTGILAAHLAWALAEGGDVDGAKGVIRQIGDLDLEPLTYQERALIFSYAALALAGTN